MVKSSSARLSSAYRWSDRGVERSVRWRRLPAPMARALLPRWIRVERL